MADYVRELRKLTGSQPIMLCGAGVIVINSKGEILLQHRIDNDLWGTSRRCSRIRRNSRTSSDS